MGAQAGEKRLKKATFAEAAFLYRLEFPGVVTLGFKEGCGCEEVCVGREKILVS